MSAVPAERRRRQRPKATDMVIGGILLIILGAVLGIDILYTIGIILLIVGAILWILGAVGRTVGPRKHYW